MISKTGKSRSIHTYRLVCGQDDKRGQKRQGRECIRGELAFFGAGVPGYLRVNREKETLEYIKFTFEPCSLPQVTSKRRFRFWCFFLLADTFSNDCEVVLCWEGTLIRVAMTLPVV